MNGQIESRTKSQPILETQRTMIEAGGRAVREGARLRSWFQTKVGD